jgi:glycine/D-amino acid oxidase-like deaminating enzyme
MTLRLIKTLGNAEGHRDPRELYRLRSEADAEEEAIYPRMDRTLSERRRCLREEAVAAHIAALGYETSEVAPVNPAKVRPMDWPAPMVFLRDHGGYTRAHKAALDAVLPSSIYMLGSQQDFGGDLMTLGFVCTFECHPTQDTADAGALDRVLEDHFPGMFDVVLAEDWMSFRSSTIYPSHCTHVAVVPRNWVPLLAALNTMENDTHVAD